MSRVIFVEDFERYQARAEQSFVSFRCRTLGQGGRGEKTAEGRGVGSGLGQGGRGHGGGGGTGRQGERAGREGY